MSTLFLIVMFFVVLTPLLLLFWGLLRFYREISRPPTEEELKLAEEFNVCPTCGASLERRWAHCPHCGAKIQTETNLAENKE